MRHWQRLPRALVESPALEVSKEGPAVALSALGWEEARIRPRMDSVIPEGFCPIPGSRGRAGWSSGRMGAHERRGKRALWAGRSGYASLWCR